MGAAVQPLVRTGGYPNSSPGPTLMGVLSLLPPQYRWTRKNSFSYGSEFLPLTASLTLTNQIGIQADSDFIITFAQGVVTDVTNLIQLAFVPQLVQLIDAAAGNSYFSIPLHFMNVYGDAQNPGVFANPVIARAAATFSVQHQNLEAVNRNVRLAFCGFRSFPHTDTRKDADNIG